MADAILHLGGNIGRLDETIRQAQLHPTATVIISSEGPIQQVVDCLKEAGIGRERVVLNALAYDTPGNFTTTWGDVKRAGARKVYVVTDQFHMERSMACAKACYFGRGVEPVPCPYAGQDRAEPPSWTLENVLVVLFWRTTGIVYVDPAVKSARSRWWEQAQREYKEVRWN